MKALHTNKTLRNVAAGTAVLLGVTGLAACGGGTGLNGSSGGNASSGGGSSSSGGTTSSGGSSSGGGSGGKSSGGTVNITVWNQATGTQVPALNAMVSAFNSSQSKVHVTNQLIPAVGTSETAFTSKVATAVSSGSGPNVVFADTEPFFVPQLINTGKVVPLNSYMAQKTNGMPAKDFIPAMLLTGEVNGKVYSVPSDGGDYAIFYNKKLFKQAGITSTPKTWSQLETDAKKLTHGGTYGFYVPWGQEEWTVWTYESMLWSNGGTFLNKSNTKAEFGSPKGVAALQVWLNMLKDKTAYPSNLADSQQSSGYPGFQDGKIAMYIDGSYDIPTNDKALGSSNVGVFAFPAMTQHAMNTGTDNTLMFKGTPAQEKASWDFIQYTLRPSVQAKYDVTTGFLPTTLLTAKDPTYKAELNKDPRLKVFTAELNYAHTRPSIAKYEQISVDLGIQLESAFLGKESAQQALTKAQDQANTILAKK